MNTRIISTTIAIAASISCRAGAVAAQPPSTSYATP
jgi:hypothetical protein